MMVHLAGNWWMSKNMKDYNFEDITERIITILKIILMVIMCGIGLLVLIFFITVTLT